MSCFCIYDIYDSSSILDVEFFNLYIDLIIYIYYKLSIVLKSLSFLHSEFLPHSTLDPHKVVPLVFCR